MKSVALLCLIGVYWALHQDFWNWRETEPLTFGFLPVGLTYHAIYTLAIIPLMALLVKFAWPADLESEVDGSGD